jgi:hypothetical protein
MSGPTTHATLIYYVGDTILIDVQITDSKGNILPLQGIDLKWVLVDPQDATVAVCGIGTGIRIVDVNGGKIEISKATDTFAPAIYRDQLRIKTLADGYIITQMVGLINLKPSLPGANPMLP